MLPLYMLRIVERDLHKLKEELSLYVNESDIWKVLPGTSNSGGTLTLHLAGNLRYFIGAVLGNSGYTRERDLEFSTRNVPLAELVLLVDTTLKEVSSALNGLDPARLNHEFPKEIGGVKRDTTYALLHLLSHLGYHLGQVNYHRRLVSSTGK